MQLQNAQRMRIIQRLQIEANARATMRGVIIYGARNMAFAERARDVAIRTEFPIVHALDKRQARTGLT